MNYEDVTERDIEILILIGNKNRMEIDDILGGMEDGKL